MNALAEANHYLDQYQTRMNQDLRGSIEERTLYEDRAYKQGMLSAAIAQAEAAQPRFVRIKEIIINVAQIAYVELNSVNWRGEKIVKVGFASMGSEAYMELHFGPDGYDATAKMLCDALSPCAAAQTTDATITSAPDATDSNSWEEYDNAVADCLKRVGEIATSMNDEAIGYPGE